MGKASVSDRPVIVRFHGQNREPGDGNLMELPSEKPTFIGTRIMVSQVLKQVESWYGMGGNRR